MASKLVAWRDHFSVPFWPAFIIKALYWASPISFLEKNVPGDQTTPGKHRLRGKFNSWVNVGYLLFREDLGHYIYQKSILYFDSSQVHLHPAVLYKESDESKCNNKDEQCCASVNYCFAGKIFLSK